jgi:shikimate dehydrogenase
MPRRGAVLKQPQVTGAARVAGVIGEPVEHSLSPVLHNAAYAELGLDWVYVAFQVPAGQGAAAVGAMRALGLAGLSVTMPHKQDVAAAVDQRSATAERLGAVNTVSWAASGNLRGDSTDGDGFLDALGDEGFDPQQRRCVVLGAGGAARAVTLALAEAGAGEVIVVARRREAAASCASLAGARGRAVVEVGEPGARGVAEAVAEVGEPDACGAAEAVAAADLVVNATPAGMRLGDGLPFGLDPSVLREGQMVVDLVYAQATTPLLREARQRGARAANGLGMLIHQAARQVEMWTGRPAPLHVMSAAALGSLAGESRREGT